VVIRVQATPERADDGAKLADEIISALATVTGSHEVVRDGGPERDVGTSPSPPLEAQGVRARRSAGQ
jgi:hypothetical protein